MCASGSCTASSGRHRVHQRALERRLHRRQVRHPLAGDVRPEQLVDLPQERLLPARQEPAVDHRLRRRRDHVRLVAGLEHRRIDGVAHRGADDPRERPELAQPALDVVCGHLQPGDLAQPVQELPHGVVDDQREPVVAQARDRLGDLGDGVVVVQERPVPRRPAGPQPHPAQALLGGLDQVHPLVVDRQREAPDLTDGLGAAVEQVGPVLDEPLRAQGAARLLVREEREDQVPRRHHAVAAELPGDRDHHRVHVLHVDRAAAPHVAVLHRPGERVHRPLRRLGGHHVQMTVDEQRAAVRGPPRAGGRRRSTGRAHPSRGPPPRTRPR